MTSSGPALPPDAQSLLDAVLAISSDLDLHSVLGRIVESAATLTSARYAALGVIGSNGELSDFVTTGLDDTERALIGELPRGHGILGLLIAQPEPLRLEDLHEHPGSYGFPANHPPMHSFLGVPVRIRGTVFGNLYLTEKAGGAGFTDQDQTLVSALAAAAGYVIDNARAFGLSERRRRWLEASAELTDSLQPPVEINDALEQITRLARSVSGARATAILGVAPAGRTTALDPQDEQLMSRLLDALDEQAGDQHVDGHPTVVIPLRAHLAERGTLVAVFDASPTPPSVEDRELLASFADQAALALDRARAVADRQELAVISDRERIARDLHDVVIQRLFASGLQLQGIRSVAENPEVMVRIDQTVDDLDLTIRDIRSTIFELQDRATASVRDDVRALVEEYAPALGLTPRLTTRGPIDTSVTPAVRDHVMAVLREALANITRHARAGRVEVRLTATGHDLLLEVEDDGIGPQTSSTSDGFTGNGLRNADERARTLGGTLALTARTPSGTSFRWAVPLA